MLINYAYAAITTPGTAEAADFVDRVNEIILFPLILLLTGVALLIFMYGAFQYILHSDDSHAHEAGRSHMMWGIVGLFIMLVAYTILSVAAGTFGLQDELDCANNPTNRNCVDTFFMRDGLLNDPSDRITPDLPANGSGPR